MGYFKETAFNFRVARLPTQKIAQQARIVFVMHEVAPSNHIRNHRVMFQSKYHTQLLSNSHSSFSETGD